MSDPQNPNRALAAGHIVPSTRPGQSYEIDEPALRRELPKLYGYSKYHLRFYDWNSGLIPCPFGLVHDGVLDAACNLAGVSEIVGRKVRRFWDLARIDLPTFVKGHVRSCIWKEATSSSVKNRRTFPELDMLEGRYIDEYIACTDMKIDLVSAFRKESNVLAPLTKRVQFI